MPLLNCSSSDCVQYSQVNGGYISIIKSDDRGITPSYLWRTFLRETLKNLFLSVNIVTCRYIQIFLGTLIGKGHLGELDIDGNKLLISLF